MFVFSMDVLHKFKIIGSSNGEPIIDSIIVNRNCFDRDHEMRNQRRQILAQNNKIPAQLSRGHWLRGRLHRSTNFDRRDI